MSRLCWKSPISTATSSRKSCLFPDSASRARPITSFTPWSDRKRGSGSLIRSARQRRRRSRSTVPRRRRPSCDSTPTRNGRASFLLFQGTDRSPIVLSGKSDGSLTALPGDGGLRLGNVGAGAVFVTDEPVSRDATSSGRASDGNASRDSVPTILVAQENFRAKTAAREGSGMARRRSIQRLGGFGPHRRGRPHQPGWKTGPRGRVDRYGHPQDPRLAAGGRPLIDLGKKSNSAHFPTSRSAWPT